MIKISIIRTIKLIARHPIAAIKDYRMFGDVDAFRAINKVTAKYMGGYNDPNVKYEGPLYEAHVKETIKEWKKMGYDDEHIINNMDTVITEAKMTYGLKYQYEQLKKINNPIIRREVDEILKESSKAFGVEYRNLYINNPSIDDKIIPIPNWMQSELERVSKMSEQEFIDYKQSGKQIGKKMVDNLIEKGLVTKVAPAAAAAAAIVVTQSPATKEYNDASSSSFKSKKSVYDSIPSTRSAGVMSRASSPETFKNGVVNMARTMDASAGQISKLLKMDAKLLEELYYDKPFLFDLYFEYSLYDDFAPSHEDSGINKLIESYEYKFGVTL